MEEAIQTWTTTRIRERLRILSQRRSAASLERESLLNRKFPGDPPSPSQRTADGGSSTRSPGEDPAWRTRYATGVSLDDVLAGLSGPPQAGADPDDALTIPVADLLAGAPTAPAPPSRPTTTFPTGPQPLGPLTRQLTMHRMRGPEPQSRRDADRRLLQLQQEIAGLDDRIADIQRILVRRSQNGNVRELNAMRQSLERLLPQKWAAQMLFDIERFVRENREQFRRAVSLADACGERFPDRERDFLQLTAVVRERLFRRLLSL